MTKSENPPSLKNDYFLILFKSIAFCMPLCVYMGLCSEKVKIELGNHVFNKRATGYS